MACGTERGFSSYIYVRGSFKQFLANPALVVRSEKIDEKGKKIILSREESIEKVSQEFMLLKELI